MPVIIKRAATNEELDQTFQLRHQVLVGDEYLARRADQRFYDRYDAFPTTCVLAALVEGQIVGTVRATVDSGIGTSVDEYFDFRSHCSPQNHRVAAGSHFYVAQGFRGQYRVSALLMDMFHFWCLRQGCRFVKGVMNPRTVSLMQRLGYDPLDAAQTSEKDGLPFIPVLLDLQRMSAPLLEYIHRQPEWGAAEPFHRLHCEAEEMIPRLDQKLYVVQGQIAAARFARFESGDWIAPDAMQDVPLSAVSQAELAVMDASKAGQ
jgi:N-acyl-L-homoserine lactone synthetase